MTFGLWAQQANQTALPRKTLKSSKQVKILVISKKVNEKTV